MTPALPADLAAAVGLGGEVGRRFAEFDWDTHPLGPPQQWAAEIRTAVAVALTSRFPIVLWVGRELFLIYNDAYAQILGDKHPAALGCPADQVWWEIWRQISPMLVSVLDTGVATWANDLMLPLMTGGQAQERYFTFTYSPIVGGGGVVTAIFCAVIETTDRVLSERRLQLLNAVATAVMDAHTIDDAVGGASRCAARSRWTCRSSPSTWRETERGRTSARYAGPRRPSAGCCRARWRGSPAARRRHAPGPRASSTGWRT